MTAAAFEANLIDYRHSVVQANKRADAGDESLEICAWCMCEIDLDPQPHRPECPGIGQPRATSEPVLANVGPLSHSPAPRRAAVDGLDALERMDAGLPQEPDLDDEEDDPDDDLGEREPQAADPASAPAIEPPAPSRSSSTIRGRVPAWTREAAIAAVQAFAAEHGHPPSHADLAGNPLLPSAPTAKRLFGGPFSDLIVAAGFRRPGRGTRYKDSSSERAASQSSERGLARLHDDGGLDDEQPAMGARTPEATADGTGEPEPGPAPDPAQPLGEAPPCGLTLDELAAAGNAMEAIASRLQHLERPSRRNVWDFIRPLIDEALA